MIILFHLGHPAHFHLFNNTISFLKNKNHEVLITIKKKDVLENLLTESGYDYINLMQGERQNGLLGIGTSLLKRNSALHKLTREIKPDIMIGTSPEITHIGTLQNIPSIVVNEDDWNIVPLFSLLSYPLSTHVVAPKCCKLGLWEYKGLKYESYHELAYLHPKYFIPDRTNIPFSNNGQKYCILRFAKLTAHHDFGKKGISFELAKKIIDLLQDHMDVYISSERKLEPEFEKYRININPKNMHHALAYADLYIGDSQTMAAEAAVLGTPSLRYNDFVGKIGYLEELEHKYGLTYGFKTNEEDKLISKIKELINNQNLKIEWCERRQKMLADKIDLTSLMIWLIENYPDSVNVIKRNPDYQFHFK